MSWEHYHPVWEADAYSPALYRCAPWSGLRKFAYDYVRNRKPAAIVELGTHYGASTSAFLQAMKDEPYQGKICVVDTWEGDEGTVYQDGEDVYGTFTDMLARVYPDVPLSIRKMTFDEALLLQQGHGIDLLHIDGSHAYADVKRDFYTWRPLIKADGAIFLHDVGGDLLMGEEMGSARLFREIAREEPYVLSLPMSCGLGLVFQNRETYEIVRDALSGGYYEEQFFLEDSAIKEYARALYFENRDLHAHLAGIRKDKEILERYAKEKEMAEVRNEETVHRLMQQAEDQNASIKEIEEHIKELIARLERAMQP